MIFSKQDLHLLTEGDKIKIYSRLKTVYCDLHWLEHIGNLYCKPPTMTFKNFQYTCQSLFPIHFLAIYLGMGYIPYNFAMQWVEGWQELVYHSAN